VSLGVYLFIGCSVGIKLVSSLIFGVIIQFFVGGSGVGIMRLRIRVDQGNSYQNVSNIDFAVE
jgi:hypothetical protein